MTFRKLYHLLHEKVEQDLDRYHDFFIELSLYQSNHFGNYNNSNLKSAYDKLPESFKKYMDIPKSHYIFCFRGDDGKNEKPVTSFVYNKDIERSKRTASFYGRYVFSLKSDVKSLSGTCYINTERLDKYFGKKNSNKIFDSYDIGDDENEVLVFDVKYL
jgi:hypothetical protein